MPRTQVTDISDDAIYQDFLKKLNKVKKNLNFSNAEFGKIVDKSHEQVRKYFNGKNQVPLLIFFHILIFTDIDIYDILPDEVLKAMISSNP